MKKVKIEYEKYTEEDLLKDWLENETELKYFIEQTGLTEEEIKKHIEEGTVIDILDEIQDYAEGAYLHLCLQCGCFVDGNVYLEAHQVCLQCASDLGI